MTLQLKRLHWLRVVFKIKFKITTIIYEAFQELGLAFLSHLISYYLYLFISWDYILKFFCSFKGIASFLFPDFRRLFLCLDFLFLSPLVHLSFFCRSELKYISLQIRPVRCACHVFPDNP